MPIRVKTRGHESIEQMLRRFKKSCEREGLTKEVKARQNFVKPSEVKRLARKRRLAPRPLISKFDKLTGPGARAGGARTGGARPSASRTMGSRPSGPRSR
ncbi:MAG: 30S ribosomal protein S21 [Planctomycetota bacterium]|nr:30S ribosomal protein S21 [Planctomycetota bacterium]